MRKWRSLRERDSLYLTVIAVQKLVCPIINRTVAKHAHTHAHVSLEQASRFLSVDGQKAAIQRLSAYPAGKGIYCLCKLHGLKLKVL